MAVTITLVSAAPNHMRYLLTATTAGTSAAVITTTGAATPDIITDLGTNQGPLLLIAKCAGQGYGNFVAGALNQNQARALWLSDLSAANPTAPIAGPTPAAIVPTAICRLIDQKGAAGAAYFIDADTSGGNARITISVIGNDLDNPSTAYLDIYVRDTIGA